MDGVVNFFGFPKTGTSRCRVAVFLVLLGFLGGTSPLGARTAKSADGSVWIEVPDGWNVSLPREGPVVILMADEEASATVTVFREGLGEVREQSALGYLFLKVDNFKKSFPISDQTDPQPLLIKGMEAARTTFRSKIPRPDGPGLDGGFIFTCLSDGEFLFTIVATTVASDFDSRKPLLNGIAGSLDLR